MRNQPWLQLTTIRVSQCHQVELHYPRVRGLGIMTTSNGCQEFAFFSRKITMIGDVCSVLPQKSFVFFTIQSSLFPFVNVFLSNVKIQSIKEGLETRLFICPSNSNQLVSLLIKNKNWWVDFYFLLQRQRSHFTFFWITFQIPRSISMRSWRQVCSVYLLSSPPQM